MARLPFFLAGAMGGGGASSGDGNVRERGEIVEREAFGVEERGELAVGDAGVDGDGASLGVERDDFVERFQERKAFLLSAMSLKQWREPRTFSLGCFLTKSWICSLGLGDVEIFGAVFEVAGPIGEFVGGGPGQKAGDGGDGDGGGGKFQEGALVHGERHSFLFWKRGHSTPDLINRDTEKKTLGSNGPTHWGAAVKRHAEYACKQKSKISCLRIADSPE